MAPKRGRYDRLSHANGGPLRISNLRQYRGKLINRKNGSPFQGRLECLGTPIYYAPVTTELKDETGEPVTRQHSSILGDYGNKYKFLSFF
jgi:hypothetical protein